MGKEKKKRKGNPEKGLKWKRIHKARKRRAAGFSPVKVYYRPTDEEAEK